MSRICLLFSINVLSALLLDGSKGTGLYTSSWVAPKSDVHSQQRFFYMGQVSQTNTRLLKASIAYPECHHPSRMYTHTDW